MRFNTKLSVTAGALAVVMWCASPVYAQRGRAGGQGQGQGRERGQSQQSQPQQSQSRGGERRATPTPQGRPEAQRPVERMAPQQIQRPQEQAAPQRFGGGAQPRQQSREQVQRAPQPVAPQRFSGSVTQRQQAPAYVQRPEIQQRSQAVPRQVAPAQTYRGTASPAYRNASPAYRTGSNYGYGASRGYYSTRYYSQPYYVVHPYVVRRPVFVQPYYAFRPYFSLSFGLHVGYGVSYPFSYWDPFAFYNYHLGIQPGYNYRTYYSRVGGISFEIDPYDAEVYVDGDFVGYASDFDPSQMPLTLQAGRHRVDLSSPGYQDVSFDITVVAGQVIPYQGTLPYGH